MRLFTLGSVTLLFSACISPETADLAPQPARLAEPAATPFDHVSFLASTPLPSAVADAAYADWLTERTDILSGTKGGSLDWHSDVAGDWAASLNATDPFAKEIYRRVALDQYGRRSGPYTNEVLGAILLRFGHTGDEADTFAFSERLTRDLMTIDLNNSAYLKAELDARGGRWWRVGEVGEEVSGKIWLLTQHADMSRDFQREALALMEPLLETGEVKHNNFAYLWDRVAVADARDQRFGTQGRCRAPGDWEANAIEQPIELLNARRIAFGIAMAFEEYDDRMDSICTQ